MIQDGFSHTKSIYDKIKSQVDAQPKDDGSLLEKRKELQREVDIAKRAYGQQVRTDRRACKGGRWIHPLPSKRKVSLNRHFSAEMRHEGLK